MKIRKLFVDRSMLPLAACIVALINSGIPSQASVIYWDGADTGANAQGGAGTWTTTTPSNWDTLAFGGADSAWTSGDTAVFGATAGTVTIGTGGVTASGLTFITSTTTGYTLTAGTNGLNFSSGSNNITFAVPQGNSSATISGTVGGSGANLALATQNLTRTSTLTFSGISSTGWTGTTTIYPNLTLATTTTSGNVNQVLNSTSGITLNGGAIQFNRATNAALNAISDSAAITVNGGGTFGATSADAGGASANETVGAVTVNSGQMNFNWTNSPSSGGQIIMPSLTVNGTSAATFSALHTTAGGRFKVTGAGTTTSGQIIGPWATTGGANGIAAQTDYAVYASDFIAPAAIAASPASTWSTTWAAGSNYTLANAAGSGANGILSPSVNVNSVKTTNGVVNLTSIASSVITVTGSSFTNGTAVQIGGTAPAPLVNNTTYYVVNASGATFQLATTPGGTPITITGAVSGNIAAGITLSSGNNLGTYGILNANGVFLPVGKGSTGGNIQLPNGTAGNLYINAGSAGIGIDAPITDGGGTLTLVKNGSSGLWLTQSNTYTGGTVLNAGTLAIGNVNNIGGAGASLTFNGTTTLAPTAALNFSSGTLTVNDGALATIANGGNVTFATTTGAGTLAFSGSGTTLNLGDALGFTGTLNALQPSGTQIVQFSKLSDTTGSLLAFGGNAGDSNQRSNFLFVGSSPLTFAASGRQVAIVPSTSSNGGARWNVLQNNSTSGAPTPNTWVINSDLVNNGLRSNVALVLDGSNTDNNAFNGAIGNNLINNGALWVDKTGAGKWILGGNNTFTGRLVVSQGTLSVATFNNDTVAGPLGMGIIQLGGTDRANGANTSYLTGSNSGILEYTGGAVTTTRPFIIGDNIAANTGGGTIANNGTGAITFSAANFNTTISGITATRTLTLAGSYTGGDNEIQGIIQDNATATTGRVGLIFNGGSWKLSGTGNSLTGLATPGSLSIRVQSGTLTISGGSTTIGNSLGLGSYSGDTGTFNQTGGTVNLAGDLIVGWNSAPSYALSGGSLTAANIRHQDATVATLTISGTANVTAPNVVVTTAGTGADGLTVNLNGGTLTTTRMYVNATGTGGSHALSINLNGGTLKSSATGNLIDVPTGSNAANASVTATVKVGGAIIDTNSNTATILRPLVHDSGLGATPDGGLTKQNSGTLLLSAACTYTGNTTINGGTLKLGVTNTLSSGSGTGNVVLDGGVSAAGTLDLNGFDQTINGLAGTTNTVLGKVVNNATGTSKLLTVGNGDATASFAGVIADNTSGTGTVALTKTGTGTQTLTGANTYTGATSVSQGTLALVGASLTSAVTVSNGASLGFSLGSTASTTSTVDLGTGTVKITGTPTLSSYLLMTASGGFSGTLTLDSPISGYQLVTANSGTELRLETTGGDTTPPTLSSIADDKSGGPVDIGTLVTYTVTFSEDMDASTVSAADFGNAGTASITIGTVTETSPGVFSVQATPTNSGTLILKINAGAELKDVAGNNLVTTSALPDDTTITIRTPYNTWANGTFANPFTDTDPTHNPDGDTLTNLQEYAFGTDPTVSSTGPITWSGATVTAHGTPVIIEESGNYYAVYGRRVDYVSAGLTYTQQFSADLTSAWYTDATTPTVIATDGVIDAVKIALPGLIPTDSGPQKARFFQCGVSQ